MRASQPNVVVIMADDMGFSDLGCMGSEIRTANIDGLAFNGARFTQIYNCGRCCPSRASLLTGLYPHQAGIGHMVADLGHPSYQGYLNDRCVTIAEVLRAHGYRTLMAGKWHVGGRLSLKRPETWNTAGDAAHPRPIDRGFDRHFGTLAGSGSYFDPHTLIEDDRFVDPGDAFYYTDAITGAAIEMIDESVAARQPFFLYLAHVAPHWPLHALPDDIARHDGVYAAGWDVVRSRRHERIKELGLLDPEWRLSPRDPWAPPWSQVAHKDWEAARMAVYAAQIHRMDQGVGAIMRRLRNHGIDDRTLVLLFSDNGGCAELLREDGPVGPAPERTRDGRAVRVGNLPNVMPGPEDTFMSYDLPWANVSNAPFRLYKIWVHEGGIATPFIAHWPGEIPSGQIRHEPAHFVDLVPTILELTGAAYPETFEGRDVTPLEGESLVAMLTGEPWQRRQPIFWEHEGNKAVRLQHWKLVTRDPDDWELYDMQTDRTELDDLSADRPDVVSDLSGLYGEWAQRAGVVEWKEVKPWVIESGFPLLPERRYESPH
jgi:arylsulfatase A-like enzyme